MSERKIEVLVAEDSPVARMLLVQLLEADPQIRVIAAVADGQAAVAQALHFRPHVVLMDLHMPKLDGFEATRRIMETRPVPIVVCSAISNPNDMEITFRSLEAGALACIEKPVGPGHGDFEKVATQLVATVKSMSEVKVIRRINRARPTTAVVTPEAAAPLRANIVGIGASTGGPPVLQTILAALPKDFPVPVLVVQHIAHGFLSGMADWLNHTTTLQIHVAAYGTFPLPGHVYLAPDDFHMGVGIGGEIVLTREPPENHLRPSVSFLFRSLARVFGPRAIGVLLTGMGQDGAEELKAMREHGALTIAQDKKSSVVHGMPGHAIGIGGASRVVPADGIAAALLAAVSNPR